MYSHEEKMKGGFTFSNKKARNDSTLSPGPGAYDSSSHTERIKES